MKVTVSLRTSDTGENQVEETTTFALPEFPKGKGFECAQIVIEVLHEAASKIGGITADLELVSVTRHEAGGDVVLDATAARAAAQANLKAALVEDLLKQGVPAEELGLRPAGQLDS